MSFTLPMDSLSLDPPKYEKEYLDGDLGLVILAPRGALLSKGILSAEVEGRHKRLESNADTAIVDFMTKTYKPKLKGEEPRMKRCVVGGGRKERWIVVV